MADIIFHPCVHFESPYHSLSIISFTILYLKRMIPGIVICGYQQEEILIDISLAVDNVLNDQKQPM